MAMQTSYLQHHAPFAIMTPPADVQQDGEGEASDIEEMDLGDEEGDNIPDADPSARAQGFKAMHERLMGQGQEAAAAASARSAAEVQQLLQQYNALEYEDHVGGVACRFR